MSFGSPISRMWRRDRLRLCRVGRRRVRPPHHRLTRGKLDAYRTGLGRAGTSAVRSLWSQGARASQQSRQSVSVDSLFGAVGGGRVEPSVGSVGDSCDNALAETILGLYKTELIWQRGPWRNLEGVEFATLKWVHWLNHRRLLEPIGNIRRRNLRTLTINPLPSRPWRPDSHPDVSGKVGAVHFAAE